MLLPHLNKHPQADLAAVATQTGLSAKNAENKFGFGQSTTDYRQILADESIDAVVVATRHASHARLTAEALEAGKAVFVEKPLSIDLEGVEAVRRAVVGSGNDRLQVGFNRRFAPLIVKMKRFVSAMRVPLVMSYRVHAGQLDSGSWYLDETEGSRFVGEAGHFFDVFAYLTGAQPFSVSATYLNSSRSSPDDRENMVVTVRYEDGSIGVLQYLTQGAKKVPKELLEVVGGGKTLQCHNFERLEIYEGTRRATKKSALDKGQRGELEAFLAAVQSGGPMAFTIDELIGTALVTLAASRAAREDRVVLLNEYWA
jgi:predicted dehydrogenase